MFDNLHLNNQMFKYSHISLSLIVSLSFIVPVFMVSRAYMTVQEPYFIIMPNWPMFHFFIVGLLSLGIIKKNRFAAAIATVYLPSASLISCALIDRLTIGLVLMNIVLLVALALFTRACFNKHKSAHSS